MKTAALYIRSIVIFATLGLGLSGCGKNGGNDNQIPVSCPAGSAYASDGNCHDQFGNIIGAESNIGMAYIGTNFPTNSNPSTMNVTNGNNFRNFLREAMGVCDRGNSGYSYGGIYSCMTWMSGYLQVVLQTPMNSNQANITFWAYPRMNSNYWYGYQLPSLGDFVRGMIGFPVISNVGAYRNPLSLNLQMSLINQSRGFEGRGYGAYDTTANIGLIQFSVANGHLQDYVLPFRLYYKGGEVANGQVLRCVQPNCGIQ